MTRQKHDGPPCRAGSSDFSISCGGDRGRFCRIQYDPRDRQSALDEAHAAVLRARHLLALAADEHPARVGVARLKREQALGRLYVALAELSRLQHGGRAHE